MSGPRSDLLESIEDELSEMKQEQKEAFKQKKRLAQRFGVGMLGEDEEMQLALMLSSEIIAEGVPSMSSDTSSKTTPTAESSREPTQNFSEADLAEAIRRMSSGI